jgi:hypothetical protein
MNRQHVFLIALALLSLVSCKSPQGTYLAQPEAMQAEGFYLHPASGMAFPLAVGSFQRVNLTRYDAEGLDVSAGYNLLTAGAGIAATVYVYPSPPLVSIGSPNDVVASARATLCKNEFEARKREIVVAHPGAKLVRESDAPLPQGGPPNPGKMAAFDYEEVFAGQQQPLHSELYVFCYIGGKWTVKYRFTSPKSFDATDAISDFMARLRWTISTAS